MAKHIDPWLHQMQQGSKLFQRGKPRDAAKAFQKATRSNPERPQGWINLASAQLESGDFQRAGASLGKARKLSPREPLIYQLLGDLRRQLGDIEVATDHYRHMVSLQRSPVALNRLACALRTQEQFDEAEQLYTEAFRRDPSFTLARVNYATQLLGLDRLEAAKEQLEALSTAPLSVPERNEVASARIALAERVRLEAPIRAMLTEGDLDALKAALTDTPAPALAIDREALVTVNAYLRAVQKPNAIEALPMTALPAEWSSIEAMFMIPIANTVEEYRARLAGDHGPFNDQDIMETDNMVPVIDASRRSDVSMTNPIEAELHLRHWHGLATQGLHYLNPGHFKQIQNWSAAAPIHKRVDPAMSSGTLRHFIGELYPALPAGLPRVATLYMTLLDLHPFPDGNSRVAMTWANRELEWQGLMPMLFTRGMGLQGELGAAVRHARSTADLRPLIKVMQEGQQFAQTFCDALAASKASGSD